MTSEKSGNNQRGGRGLSGEEWKHLIKQAGLDAAKVATRGIGLRIMLNILTGLSKTVTDKHPFNTKLLSFLFGKSVRRTGTLLGGFVFTYKVLLETLPRYTNLSDKQSDFIAGALSGLWILVESASVRTIYGVGIASRAIHGLLKSANNNQKLNVPKGTDILFSLSAAQIFFSFIAHPLAFSPSTMMNMLEKTGVSYSTIRNNLEIINGRSLEKYSFINSHLLNTIDPNNLARLYALSEQPNLIPCASIHPSQASCLVNIFTTIVKGIKKNIAFYFAMNLVPGAMFKRKAFLSDPLPRIKDAIKATLKSVSALGLFIFLLQGQLCATRNIFGNTRFFSHRYVYFFQALFAAFTAIQFETSGRKKELTLIFTTQAVETFYKVLRLKGILPRVPHFESALFALGAGVFLTLIRHEPKSLDSIDHKVATKILRLNSIHDPEPSSFNFFGEDDEDEDKAPSNQQGKSTYSALSTSGHSSERNLADSQHSVGSSSSEKFESIGERDLASSQDSVSQSQEKPTSKKGKRKNKQNQQSGEQKDLNDSVQSLD